MNTPAIPSLNLGDLNALQVGAEVVTVFVDGSGTIELGRPAIVSSVEVDRIRIRRSAPPAVMGAYSRDGKTLCHLYGPLAYLSANPAHIARAKEAELEEQAFREGREAALKARTLQARPIADELATDEAEIVASVLANRLDSAQIATLAGWLHVD